MLDRRSFVKQSAILGGLAGISLQDVLAKIFFNYEVLYKSALIAINKPAHSIYWKPLEEVSIQLKKQGDPAKIRIWDGQGNHYAGLSGLI